LTKFAVVGYTIAKVRYYSGILMAVPSRAICLILVLGVALAPSLTSATRARLAQEQPTQTPAAPTGQTAPQNPPPTPAQPPIQLPAPPAPPVTPPQPPPPPKTLAVVVLDPAHGGTDQGARGSTGISESDVVLSYARLMRISLEAQGFRVLLTRQANEDPSFDDRSKQVNAQRGAVLLSLHVSSTGAPGTVRVYSLQPTDAPATAGRRTGLVSWDRAQGSFLGQSRRLAELIQIQMAQRFHGSPETPIEAPVRQLRTISAPAVAIEVSSVSLPNRSLLDQMGPGIADGVARAVAAFRTVYQAGGN
jgi:N-acetylmuramoyl-L-alanine amidase